MNSGRQESCGNLSGMTPECIFTQALGLVSPWKVVSANFDAATKSLELFIDFIPGSGFTLLMEAYLLLLAKVMPVTEVSK
jgi:hypothetical protein